ncbi:hypothetical protein [Plantactinospora veratri]
MHQPYRRAGGGERGSARIRVSIPLYICSSEPTEMSVRAWRQRSTPRGAGTYASAGRSTLE